MLSTFELTRGQASPRIDCKQGQKLLILVRRLENEDDADELAAIFDETKESLLSLIQIVSKEGLLRGDAQKAREILLVKSVDSADNRSNKRGRRKDDPSSKYTGDDSAASDERLLMTALARIFGLNEGKFRPSMLLVMMCADLCSTVLEYVESDLRSSVVCIAEHTIMASSWTALLNGLIKAIKHLLSIIHPAGRAKIADKKSDVLLDLKLAGLRDERTTLESCLIAVASLVKAFGTQLSRNSSVVSDIWTIGLTTLTLPDNDIQMAASELLAALSWTGVMQDTKSNSQSVRWSEFLMDVVVGLSTVLQTPLSLPQAPEGSTWPFSKEVHGFFGELVTYLEGYTLHHNEKEMGFRFLVNGLSTLIMSLLKRHPLNCLDNEALLTKGSVGLDQVFWLLGTMLSCKGFLKGEGVRQAATHVSCAKQRASFVNRLGHQLLRAFVSTVGIPPLVCRADRILRMVSSTVETPILGGNADQESAVPQQGLSGSSRLTMEVVQTFAAVVSMFGVPPTRVNNASCSFSMDDSHRSAGAEKIVALAGGLLMGLLWSDGRESMDMGALVDRVELVQASANLLASIVQSCGGFMPLPTRILIDSFATAGLKALSSPDATRVTLSPMAKVAILRLGSTCLTSPLGSGALSSVGEELYLSALKCREHDLDTRVEASFAMRLCETTLNPRVPALFIDTTLHEFRPKEGISGESLFTPKQKHFLDHDVAIDKSNKTQLKTKRRKAEAGDGDAKESTVAVKSSTTHSEDRQQNRDTTNEANGSGHEIPKRPSPLSQVGAKEIVHGSLDALDEEEEDDDDIDALPLISNEGPDEGDV